MPDPVPTQKVTRTVRRPVKKGNDLGTNLGIFALTFLLSLGGGYLLFNRPAPAPATASTPATTSAPAQSEPAPAASTANTTETPAAASTTPANGAGAPLAEGAIFTKRGCVACHSISALNVKGGVTGPDLSKAYVNVPDKHGMPVEEFLKKPNSAVMSGVLGANPLTDDERAQVIAALKAASEK